MFLSSLFLYPYFIMATVSMYDYDDEHPNIIYLKEKTDETGYWTRRQFFLTFIALLMVIIIIIYLALPTINYVIRQNNQPTPYHQPTMPPSV